MSQAHPYEQETMPCGCVITREGEDPWRLVERCDFHERANPPDPLSLAAITLLRLDVTDHRTAVVIADRVLSTLSLSYRPDSAEHEAMIRLVAAKLLGGEGTLAAWAVSLLEGLHDPRQV